MIEFVIVLAALLAVLALDLAAFAARTSFLQSGHARLLNLRERDPSAERVLALWPRRSRLRSSLNLTLVFTRFSLAALTLWLIALQPLLYPRLIAVVGLLISGLIVFWAEWALERIALQNPEETAIALSGFVRVLLFIAAPFLVPISAESAAEADIPLQVTEDEMKSLIAAGQEEGLIEQDARKMLDSVLDLSKTFASEIMVPRIDILALDAETSIHQAVDELLRAGHSRVPVYRDSVDNILGVLYAKDLLRVLQEENQDVRLEHFLRKPAFVPESKQVDELLAEMQNQHVHMAIVVDEYGGVAGLVTLEDILEEFLGEIQDEYDIAEEAPYQELGDGAYTFQGRITLNDFNEIMGSRLESEDANTLGGYIYEELGRVPTVGEQISVDGLSLTVEQVSARRIRRVIARHAPTEPENTKDENETIDE